MALEAHGYGVFDAIVATLCAGHDVVCLDFDAAEPVADATPSMALYEQLGYLIPRERHSQLPPSCCPTSDSTDLHEMRNADFLSA
jgi:hypothetical protein